MENNNETPRVDIALPQNTVPPVTVNGTSNNIPQPLRFELSQLNSIPLNSQIAYFAPASDLLNSASTGASTSREQPRYFIYSRNNNSGNQTQNSSPNDPVSRVTTDPLSTVMSHTSSTTSPSLEARYVGVKIAAEMVPIFDGNTPPVATFVRDCKFAQQSVHPGDRPFLAKLIRTRVKGDANAYLQNTSEPENLGELLDVLRLAFSPQGDLSQLQAEMSSVIQKSSESVLQYGIRVSEILRKTIEVIEQDFPVEAATGMRLGANRNATSCFIRGLQPEIESRVSLRNPITLQHAISTATIVENEVLHLKQLHRAHEFKSDQTRTHLNRCYTGVRQVAVLQGQEAGPSSQNDSRCYNCGKKGHYKRQCTLKSSRFSDNKTSRNGAKHQNIKTCDFCNMKNHLSEKCFLRVKFEQLKEEFFRKRDQGSQWKKKRDHELGNQQNSRKSQNQPSDESSAS